MNYMVAKSDSDFRVHVLHQIGIMHSFIHLHNHYVPPRPCASY